MIYAGSDLARRLEAAEALNGVACAEAGQRLDPALGSAVLEVNGGFAIFVGTESPLTRVLGLGMCGPVRADELARVEDFFSTRGAPVNLDLCPLADASLVELLAGRGYRLQEFNTVLVRPLAGLEIAPTEIAVRQALTEEGQLWSLTVGRGFLEKDELMAEELDVGRTIWHMSGSRCYLALDQDRAAAAAAMWMHCGLAMLFADSTVLGHRGAGLQVALIRERLRIAAQKGCDLATASTLPGSVSQRNYERMGFQVAYTKAMLVRR